MIFGLITEGPTDQLLLRSMLARYIHPDVEIRTLQPNTDATDGEKNGGWSRIEAYCKSADMLAMLQALPNVVIQIDTDVCEDYGVPKRANGADLTEAEIIEGVKERLQTWIGTEVCQKYKDKILFAICHESIECWLLPLYFTDKRRAKTTNCCDTLNQELSKSGYTIDCVNKKPIVYNTLCKNIRKKTDVLKMAEHSLNCKSFLDSLPILAV